MAITITRPTAAKVKKATAKKPRRGSKYRAKGVKRVGTTTIVRT
jgi:hypothetical protein